MAEPDEGDDHACSCSRLLSYMFGIGGHLNAPEPIAGSTHLTPKPNIERTKNVIPAINAKTRTIPGPITIPKSLAIYYGYPSSTNHEIFKWDINLIANFYTQFDYIIFGGSNPSGIKGLHSLEHPDHENTRRIIESTRSVHPQTQFYGYIVAGGGSTRPLRAFTIPQLKTQIDEWIDQLSVQGIFIDEAGNDFWDNDLEMRKRLHSLVSHAHSRGLRVAYNAWNPEDLFTNFPNLPLPRGVPGKPDAALYESYIFSAADSAESFIQNRNHIRALQDAKRKTGIEIWATPTVQEFRGNSSKYVRFAGSTDWNFLTVMAALDDIDAVALPGVMFSATDTDAGVVHVPTISKDLLVERSKDNLDQTEELADHPNEQSKMQHDPIHLFEEPVINEDEETVSAATNKGILQLNFAAKNYTFIALPEDSSKVNFNGCHDAA
ncbi:hypothetical protein HDU76_013661 [Blyttiomyces sp. JEL0837]|nr:hypothetical protein HDU76_013661 [Blyttiomyces sp. JEL0837]